MRIRPRSIAALGVLAAVATIATTSSQLFPAGRPGARAAVTAGSRASPATGRQTMHRCVT